MNALLAPLTLRRTRLKHQSPRKPGPVRVCFMIDCLSRAGTETQLLALIERLDRRVVAPSLCLLNGTDPLSRELAPRNCPVLHLGLESFARRDLLRKMFRLCGFWREQAIDVLQTYFLDSTYFGVPLARLMGIRRIVRVRNNIGHFLTPRHSLLGKLYGRLVDVTLTNSEIGRVALQKAELLTEDRIAVLENGVDLERYLHAPPPNIHKASIQVGMVANLRTIKNVDGLIRVARQLCEHHPRLSFAVAGDGPERDSLQRQIDAARLSNCFRLTGSLSDVPAFLARQDIAVLCSHAEGMSNALMEYMASGRAIVATNVGGNHRLIEHEVHGLLVPPRDDQALAAAIDRYLREPQLARRLGQAARQRVESEFSRDAMRHRFEAFYTQLVEH